MKNWEVYEEKIKEFKGNIAMNRNDELVACDDIYCYECKFNDTKEDCAKYKLDWLYQEYHQKPKIKIPLATKVILESLNDKYEWIAKDKDDTVWLHEYKPYKISCEWECNDNSSTHKVGEGFKKELFDFLSWEDEEPISIGELLENCEVIEDE